jgi:OmpA-OmpF porin, OOP family
MRKLATVAVALALGATSATAFADTGNAFVNANVGSSDYNSINNAPTNVDGYDSYQKKYAAAGALRVGYRWNSVVDYGFEVGYGYMGTARSKIYNDDGGERLNQKNRGWLLGGNLNYNITDHWYVSGRAGWYRARNMYSVSAIPSGTYDVRGIYTATGEYFGIGGGYNINKNFSVGLAYDYYHTPGDILRSTNPDVDGAAVNGSRIGMYSIQGEYRF